MSGAGDIIAALTIIIEAAVPGVTIETEATGITATPPEEFPFCVLLQTDYSVDELDWRQEGRAWTVTGALYLNGETDTRDSVATFLDAINAGIDADPTLGGIVDLSTINTGEPDSHPDSPLIAGDFEVTSVRVDGSFGPVPVISRAASTVESACAAATVADGIMPSGVGVGAAVGGTRVRVVTLAGGGDSTSSNVVRPITFYRVQVLHLLVDSQDEDAYLREGGPADTAQQTLMEAEFWRELAGTHEITQAPELDLPERVGNVIEYIVTVGLSLTP